MAVTLNETAVKAVEERLTDDLAAQVTAINAAVTDGYQIENPAEILPFIPPPDILTEFPTVAVGDGPSTFEDDTGFAMTGRHELLIVVYLQDAEQEALAWKLRRYTQAICRVVLSGRELNSTVDGAGWGTGLVRVSPGPTLTDNEDPDQVKAWVSWAGVQIWVKREEA